jgi:hypothetical protein
LVAGDEDTVAVLDEVQVLDVILAEGLEPSAQVLDQAVEAAVDLAEAGSGP